MSDTIKLSVTMDVTIPQALALTEMFKYWTELGNSGSSREVVFFVDGDRNFRPNCQIVTSDPLPIISDKVRASCRGEIKATDGSRVEIFESIAWSFKD